MKSRELPALADVDDVAVFIYAVLALDGGVRDVTVDDYLGVARAAVGEAEQHATAFGVRPDLVDPFAAQASRKVKKLIFRD
jgi:hypothetical protein